MRRGQTSTRNLPKRHHRPTCNLPKRNQPSAHVICPNETVGAVPVCPPERPRSSVSIPKTHALCAGFLTMDAPLQGDTGGHTGTAPTTLRNIFPRIPHKQNSVHAQFTPNEINRPCAIRPYQSPPNHAVCHYRVAVILSIAQGWQVQRSLPWVMVQARRLPPWGLYFFHHIAF